MIIVIVLAMALGLTIAALVALAVRQRRIIAHMTRLDSRVRALGIVHTIVQGPLDKDRGRHLRRVKGLILLPIGWAVHQIRARPAQAAIAGAGAAALTLGGLTLWPEEPHGDDVRRPTRTEIVGPPEPTPTSEVPRFRSPAPVVPDPAGEGVVDSSPAPAPADSEPGTQQQQAPAVAPPAGPGLASPSTSTTVPPAVTPPEERCLIELGLIERAEVCLPGRAHQEQPSR